MFLKSAQDAEPQYSNLYGIAQSLPLEGTYHERSERLSEIRLNKKRSRLGFKFLAEKTIL